MTTSNDIINRDGALAFVYGFLSQAFAYPTTEIHVALERAVKDLPEALAICDIRINIDHLTTIQEQIQAWPDTLESTYNQLFVTELRAPAAETAYETDKAARRAAELADIAGFYQAFGIKLAWSIEPDNITTELEFMSLLAHKCNQTHVHRDAEGESICRSAYHTFLSDHIGRWFRIFCENVVNESSARYYVSLCHLLRAVLIEELNFVGGTPTQPMNSYVPDTANESSWCCSECNYTK